MRSSSQQRNILVKATMETYIERRKELDRYFAAAKQRVDSCLSVLHISKGLVQRDITLVRTQLELTLQKLESKAEEELNKLTVKAEEAARKILSDVQRITDNADQGETGIPSETQKLLEHQMKQIKKHRFVFKPNKTLKEVLANINCIGYIELIDITNASENNEGDGGKDKQETEPIRSPNESIANSLNLRSGIGHTKIYSVNTEPKTDLKLESPVAKAKSNMRDQGSSMNGTQLQDESKTCFGDYKSLRQDSVTDTAESCARNSWADLNTSCRPFYTRLTSYDKIHNDHFDGSEQTPRTVQHKVVSEYANKNYSELTDGLIENTLFNKNLARASRARYERASIDSDADPLAVLRSMTENKGGKSRNVHIGDHDRRSAFTDVRRPSWEYQNRSLCGGIVCDRKMNKQPDSNLFTKTHQPSVYKTSLAKADPITSSFCTHSTLTCKSIDQNVDANIFEDGDYDYDLHEFDDVFLGTDDDRNHRSFNCHDINDKSTHKQNNSLSYSDTNTIKHESTCKPHTENTVLKDSREHASSLSGKHYSRAGEDKIRTTSHMKTNGNCMVSGRPTVSTTNELESLRENPRYTMSDCYKQQNTTEGKAKETRGFIGTEHLVKQNFDQNTANAEPRRSSCVARDKLEGSFSDQVKLADVKRKGYDYVRQRGRFLRRKLHERRARSMSPLTRDFGDIDDNDIEDVESTTTHRVVNKKSEIEDTKENKVPTGSSGNRKDRKLHHVIEEHKTKSNGIGQNVINHYNKRENNAVAGMDKDNALHKCTSRNDEQQCVADKVSDTNKNKETKRKLTMAEKRRRNLSVPVDLDNFLTNVREQFEGSCIPIESQC